MGYLVVGRAFEGPSCSYLVERALPKSGFAQAFVGRDQGGNRVLLKEVHLADIDGWKRVDALRREAQSTAHLRHSHIARFIEIFAFDGEKASPASIDDETKSASLVLVRSFVEGMTLAEAIRARRRFTAAELETIFRGLLDARRYLDTLIPTVVHGDASPNNVIIDERGAPWLIDFGAVSDEIKSSPSAAVGTSGFMPPEQLAGRATAASDLYAIGMTVVSAASHRNAHEMPVDPQTLRIPLHEVVTGLPARMSRALQACLEPSLRRRARSADEALQILDGDSMRMVRAKAFVAARAPRIRKPLWVALGLLVSLAPTLAIALPLWQRVQRNHHEPPVRWIAGPPMPILIGPTAPTSSDCPLADVNPTPPPAPVVAEAATIQWVGRVERAQKELSKGDSCLLTLKVTDAVGSPQCNVTLRCNERLVVDNIDAGDCALSETYTASGALTYRAGLNALRPNNESGTELAMSFKTGLFRVTEADASGAKLDETVVALEPRSMVNAGSPILGTSRFEDPVTVEGTALRSDGARDIHQGESCSYTLKPNPIRDASQIQSPNCIAVVKCGSTVLYDQPGVCMLTESGAPYELSDAQGSEIDGSPTLSVSGHELEINDQTPEKMLDVLIYLDRDLMPPDINEH